MVVAMNLVRMMQVAIDEIVDVVAVRHRFVSAAGAMHMVLSVRAALVIRRAQFRVGAAHIKRMLVDMTGVNVVQVAVVQVVDMPRVQDARVAALVVVLMGVFFMDIATHGNLLKESIPAFVRMFNHGLDKIEDMLVCQAVEKMFSLSPPLDEIFPPEQAQALGDS